MTEKSNFERWCDIIAKTPSGHVSKEGRMMELSADEIETVKNLIEDWGFEYSLKADTAKVGALAAKLGLDRLAKEYQRS